MLFEPKTFNTNKGKYYIDRIGQISRKYDWILDDGHYIGKIIFSNGKYDFYMIGSYNKWKTFDTIEDCINELAEFGY